MKEIRQFRRIIPFLFVQATCCLPLFSLAQPIEKMIKVVVAPDHPDWYYRLGEKVNFSVSVIQNGNPIRNAKIWYELMPEKMEPTKKESLTLENGQKQIDGGTMKSAGFLRC